jgi:hypothetical protein
MIPEIFTKEPALRKKLNEKLKELDKDSLILNVDPTNIMKQLSTIVKKSSDWGKVLAYIYKMKNNFEIEFDSWKANEQIQIKARLKDTIKTQMKLRKEKQPTIVDELKESDVKAELYANNDHKKIKLIIARWDYYYKLVENTIFWPITKMPDVLKSYENIINRTHVKM